MPKQYRSYRFTNEELLTISRSLKTSLETKGHKELIEKIERELTYRQKQIEKDKNPRGRRPLLYSDEDKAFILAKRSLDPPWAVWKIAKAIGSNGVSVWRFLKAQGINTDNPIADKFKGKPRRALKPVTDIGMDSTPTDATTTIDLENL